MPRTLWLEVDPFLLQPWPSFRLGDVDPRVVEDHLNPSLPDLQVVVPGARDFQAILTR